MEEWCPVDGFPDYAVSNLGRIKRLVRSKTSRAGLILKGGTDNGGYQHVILWHCGKSKIFKVHRLVLTTFVGPCPPSLEALHKDNDRQNNALSNLRWGTRKENADDRSKAGSQAGHRNGQAKLTLAQVAEIRKRYKPYDKVHGGNPMAREYGIGLSTMESILAERTWNHETLE